MEVTESALETVGFITAILVEMFIVAALLILLERWRRRRPF